MKIKIKNNKNMQELNEGQLLELDNPATQQTKKSSAANLYKALAAK
jgi:cold shock CspA family protein